MEIDEQLGDLLGKSMRLNNIGMVCKAMGRYTDALKYCEEALNTLRVLGLNETPRAAPYKKNIVELKNLLFNQNSKNN
ncbi:MAG: tetratricopeptide repeat protein [Promethearchaeota archaeon]